MSDFTRPTQSDFIREMQRLHDAQRAAILRRDIDAIEHAAHEMTVFLCYNAAGRLTEYFDRELARGRQAAGDV